jgi:hypothetical protein
MLFKALSCCCVVISHILHSFSIGLRLYCRHLEAQKLVFGQVLMLVLPCWFLSQHFNYLLPAYVVSATEMAHNLLSMCAGL